MKEKKSTTSRIRKKKKRLGAKNAVTEVKTTIFLRDCAKNSGMITYIKN